MRVPDIDAVSLETLLSAAVAAPSVHNTQPWRFGLDPVTRTVAVRSAPERALALADPTGRAQYLSVGAAVFNLRVAATHLGWDPAVRLLPDPADPAVLAIVRLTSPSADPPADPDLYDAIARRHSSRMPFTGRPVPEAVVAEMVQGAQAEGGRLYVPGIVDTGRLLALTAAGEHRNGTDRARRAETRKWITRPGAGPYGIPTTALGPRDVTGRMPVRDFGATRPGPAPTAHFERHTQVALLWTAHDGREDWLRAGQALEHVLLVATVHGVRTSLLHQAVEWPDLRIALRDPQQRTGYPQILIRFGYGPEAGRTPRAPATVVVPAVPSRRPRTS